MNFTSKFLKSNLNLYFKKVYLQSEHEKAESILQFNPQIIEKRGITMNPTDDNLTKLNKVFEMIYYNCLHYLTFSHVFLSRHLIYPYNYFIYMVFGYILACLLGVSNGDGIYFLI